MSCSLILTTIFTYLLIKYFRRKDPEPIFGIYTQIGKWYPFKYFTFLILFYVRKWRYRSGSKDGGGRGAKNVADINLIDRPQSLSEHPKAFDAVFFIGANSDGYKFVMGTERRHNGLIHTVLYFRIPNKGLFSLPCTPDTCLFSTEDGSEGNGFEVAGLKCEPIKVMNKWRLTYTGNVRKDDKLYSVKFEADWTSQFNYFDFDTDMDPKSIVSAIARESWSKEYFEQLKQSHQTHYEQMGILNGTVEIDGEIFKLNLQSFRDHSYGFKRDWTLMHRYAFFILFFIDGSSMSLGIICQPCTSSTLKIGSFTTKTGKILPISSCDFELYQHGEMGEPPKDHAFQFKVDKKLYTLQILVEDQSTHYKGTHWEAKLVERFVNCTLNGIAGYGISEFQYRNYDGRPESYTINDPKWFKKL